MTPCNKIKSKIATGEMDGSMTGRLKLAQEALVKAGLKCEVSDRIRVKLVDDIVANTLARSDSLNKAVKPSVLRDLEPRRRLEIDALNGTVSRMAR